VAGIEKTPKTQIDPLFSKIRYPSRSPWRIRFHFPELSSLMNLQDQFRQGLSASMEYAHQDALGESFLYSYITLEKSNFEQAQVGQSLLHVAAITYQGLTETYPDRLAAWFNLGRLCFELNELQSAKAVFEAIQANPQLRYDANDILFWREFQDGLFDYDRMMEEMVNYRKTPDPKHLRQIEKLIRESVVYYQSNILLAEGKTTDALAWLTQNMTPETEFVPSWTLRAILNLHAGRASEALADLKIALGRKEYILPKIGAEFFEVARNQGLELGYYEQRLKRLMSRLVV
jgi:tetratricopeptide (TPR) repeat protein